VNSITANRRHYEDLALGEVVDLGSTTVTKEMIVSFAREFDPFPFHLDEEAAKASLLGGLASSGWQTAALSLRMLAESFLNTIASFLEGENVCPAGSRTSTSTSRFRWAVTRSPRPRSSASAGSTIRNISMSTPRRQSRAISAASSLPAGTR